MEHFIKSFGCFSPRRDKSSSSSSSNHHPKLRLTCSSSFRSRSISSRSSSSSIPKSPPKLRSRREEELQQVFSRFDCDKDGKISASELKAYFASVGEYMSDEDAQGAIHDLDTDGDDFLGFQDFKRMMMMTDRRGEGDDNEEEEEDLKAAFQVFEAQTGSGRITPRSLQRVLSLLGDSKSYAECAAMIQAFDIDGNGELDYHEFHQMMMP